MAILDTSIVIERFKGNEEIKDKIKTKEQMCKWAASLSTLLVIALFCSLSVGIANVDSYTYTLSGGPSLGTPL